MDKDKRQLIFIDDAGDPGFNFSKGSSRYFVISCVAFDSASAAEATAKTMRLYKSEVGFSPQSEFKFNKTRKSVIMELLHRISKLDFRVQAIVIDKPRISDRKIHTSYNALYSYAIAQALSRFPHLQNASIRLDEHAGKEYQRSAKTFLKRTLNESETRISDIRFIDSRRNTLIQLADLTAGSIYRSKQADKTDHSIYIELLKKRITDIWEV
jgi:hypothetical protein